MGWGLKGATRGKYPGGSLLRKETGPDEVTQDGDHSFVRSEGELSPGATQGT